MSSLPNQFNLFKQVSLVNFAAGMIHKISYVDLDDALSKKSNWSCIRFTARFTEIYRKWLLLEILIS